MLARAEGIVIKTVDYGEGNKIITLFTEKYGKITLMARGAKKTKSRLSSVSQLFSYSDYTFFLTKSMGTLKSGDIIQSFTKIQQDIIKTAYAAYLVELTDKMIEKHEPIPFLYQQLLSALKQIDEGKDSEIITRIYELKILEISGYRPVLNHCVLCDAHDHLKRFSVIHGGLICDHHPNESSVVLQEGTIKLLRLFEDIDIRRIGNIHVKESTKSQMQFLMRSFIEHHAGIQLKSQHFLDQIKQFE
ncbi:DNA repair protein RecO [Tepidibacillus sp. LV47]|uniref:DNA repair protein RecO n=1 Tax=Tepidibacillus sp. LV47 TaxID=3398228 RepID=UPI003AAB2C2B